METCPARELPLPPPVPLKLALTSTVVLLPRSRKKTSTPIWLLSLVTKSLAELEYNTNRPSALIHGVAESPLAPAGKGSIGFRVDADCSWPAHKCGTATRMPPT